MQWIVCENVCEKETCCFMSIYYAFDTTLQSHLPLAILLTIQAPVLQKLLRHLFLNKMKDFLSLLPLPSQVGQDKFRQVILRRDFYSLQRQQLKQMDRWINNQEKQHIMVFFIPYRGAGTIEYFFSFK